MSRREQRLRELVERLSDYPEMTADCERILRCQDSRLARSRYPYRCRHVLCRSCRPCAGRTWRRDAREAFEQADGDACVLATILLCRSGDLATMRDVLDRFRVDLRNLRDRLARRDARWASVTVRGQIEVDAIPHEVWADVPDERRAVLDALPCASFDGSADVTWVPHAHLCLFAPGLSRWDIAEALSRQWPGAGRAHVTPFHESASPEDNLAAIVSYSVKHRCENKLRLVDDDGERVWLFETWPLEIQILYWRWIKDMGRGLSPLRVKLNARTERSTVDVEEIDFERVRAALHVDDPWDGVPLPFLV